MVEPFDKSEADGTKRPVPVSSGLTAAEGGIMF